MKVRSFAAEKHARQRRKYSDQPYFNHLHAVAELLREAGVEDLSVIAAAYLHDTVEDTDATMQQIIEEFGHDIAELVYWMTDSEEGNRDSTLMLRGGSRAHRCQPSSSSLPT